MVIRGRLTLGVLVAVLAEVAGEVLRADVQQAIGELGLDVAIDSSDDQPVLTELSTTPSSCWAGPSPPRRSPSSPARSRRWGSTSTSSGGVSDYPVTGLELRVSVPPVGGAYTQPQTALAACRRRRGRRHRARGLQPARRAKRLIVFDVDSTLIQGEVIEMLAARAGAEAKVAAITEAAMRGELDFEESLRNAWPRSPGCRPRWSTRSPTRRLTPGPAPSLRTLRRLGYHWRCGVGRVPSGDRAAGRGTDARPLVAANHLEIVDGKADRPGDRPDRPPGQGQGAGVDFANQAGVPMEQTVAVGDGANDIDMLVGRRARGGVQRQARAAGLPPTRR